MAHTIVGQGDPVVLLHGLGGDRRQSLGLLPPQGPIQRIVPEMPGHGTRDLLDDEPVSFAHFADLVAQLLDSLVGFGRCTEPVAVAGVSMGAGIAVALTARRPDLVKRLVLIRPSWLDVSPAPNLAVFEVVADLLARLGPVDGRAAYLRTAVHRDLERQAPAMARSALGQFGRPHAVERARVLAEMPYSLPLPDRGGYERLRVPVLVLVAPQDPVHDESIGATLAQWIPRANLERLPRKLVDSADHDRAIRDRAIRYITKEFEG
ncbi:alpha/beta fold hydrolase [Streptomyces prunicolor]|uniref:alpha/beta fold hydrolase n=1 Tax=Streptomyces prunicolor TaxID=67348 RepID=UPI00131A23CB|nr:alpha/beta hydrolase [Streptomyces prunicolor]